MCTVPDGFATHPDVHSLLSARRCVVRRTTSNAPRSIQQLWESHGSLRTGTALALRISMLQHWCLRLVRLL